jgi:hypothetical protein
MSRATMMAALLGMGLAVPDSAATPATADPSGVSASSSPTQAASGEVSRPPGDAQQVKGAPFTVESVDRSDRLLIVRSPGCARTTVPVGPTST